MKFQSNPQTAPNWGLTRKLGVAVITLGLSAASALAQFTWDGGDAASPLWSAGTNWVGDVAPANVFNANYIFSGVINNGSASVQLTNDLTTGTITNVTFDATAGSFYATGNIVTNRGNMTNLSGVAQFWNVPMIMMPKTNFFPGQETNYAHFINVGSSSLWLGGLVTNTTSGSAFVKSGTGTLYLTNGGFNILGNAGNSATVNGTNFGGAFNLDEGSMVLNGGASSVYLVQGEATFGRSGVWGNKAVSVTINSGMWTNNNWLALGRGNGTGATASDLTLNGSAQLWPINWSAGFNAGDASRAGTGTITLNGTSIFGVGNNNGNYNLGESFGSYFTMTMNDSSRHVHPGAASGTRIGVSGTGVLSISTNAVVDVRNLVIGVGANGNGAVYNKGQIMSIQQDGLFLGDGTNSSSYFRNDNAFSPGPNTNAASIVAGIGSGTGGNQAAVVDVISGTLTGTRIGFGFFQNTPVAQPISAQFNVLGGTLGSGTGGYIGTDATGRTGTKWGNVNVTGSGLFTNITVNLSQPNLASVTSIVSVATGGTIAADTITATGANALTFLNFNNGTFIGRGNTVSLVGANVDRVTIYSGGVTIETTTNKTIDTLVAAPVADGIGSFGVTSVTLSGTGTGYEGRPIVKISGDGTGASGYAIFDPVTGLVTGVTMTSAGSGYTVAPAVQILGGGGSALTATASIGAVASGGLTKTGAGSLTLNGGYTYTGTTLVSVGTLGLNAASTTPGAAAGDLVDSATLSLSLNNGASSIPASNVTLSAGSVLNLDYGTVAATPVAAVLATGTLTAPGATTTINIAGFGLSTGQIPLIDYSVGALSGAQFANIALGTLPPGVVATLSNNVANTSVDLVITSTGQNLYWRGVDDLTGLSDANWNINTTTNWLSVGGAAPSVYKEYTTTTTVGDPVLFDDTVTSQLNTTNVILSTLVRPFLVTVDTTLPYSITGTGSIAGQGKLVKTNSGSLFIGTTNNYTGGTIIGGGSVIITNNAALGTNTGGVTLIGGTLQMNANMSSARSLALTTASSVGVAAGATSTWSGVISGTPALSKKDLGTFVTTRTNTITGNIFVNQGAITVDTFGLITNGSYHSIGQTSGDNGTMNLRGSGAFSTTFDFNVGDINDAIGVLNIQDTATLIAANLFVSSGNNVGSTANGTVNQIGGTVTQTGTGIGTFAIGGRRDAADNGAVGTYNMSGGTLTAFAGIRVGGNGTGTVNHTNGTINARGGINIARNTGSTGTYNLVGGTLATLNVASSTGINSVFNFNGGVLQAAFSPATPFMSGLTSANILAGGAIIDASTNAITITQPLLNGGGGLTKRGTASLTLTGANTYTGTTLVSTGALFVTTAHQVTGPTVIADNATFGVTADTAAAVTIGNLTLGSVSNSTLQFTLVSGTNPVAKLLQCGTLTKNGTNTIRLSGLLSPGTFPLLQYSAQAGTGIINTNALVPHGIVGTISNDNVSTIWVTISGTPGVVWQGYSTIAGRTNLWDLNTTTNWLAAGSPSDYAETTPPGDSTTFSDSGSGIVLLSNTVSPASVLITNNSVAYTFTGSGRISGTTSITKMGTGTAILALTNANTYAGNTIISNGTLALGSGVVIPDTTATTVIGSAGTLQLGGFSETINAFAGSGLVDNNGGGAVVLTVGAGNGNLDWSGTIANSGAGGVSLIKNGTGTAVIKGTNTLASGAASQVNGSAMFLTNNAVLDLATAEFWVQQNAGTASLTVDGNAKLICQNNWIAIGRNNVGAIGTLTVNGGTVQKSGANGNIIAGSIAGNGTITVNGGQILNSSMLWLGENAGSVGTLNLNGGLIQATQVRPNTTPTSSTANFNGGIMQASAASADFFGPNGTAVRTTLNILAGGLYFDTQAFAVTNQSDLVDAGGGGGLVKLGTGSLDITSGGNSYTGLTIVSNGTLNIHGTIPGAVTVKSGATLGGNGIIGGVVTVQAGGTLGAGASIGLLTLNSSPVLGGSVVAEINNAGPVNDQIVVTALPITYGGTLVVSNVGAVLTTNDTFTLFTASAHSGAFSSITNTGTPLDPALGLSFTNGILSVVSLVTVANNPTNITSSVSGSTLNLSWPADHLGWFLQTQTNTRPVGLSSNWFDVTGSDTITNTAVTLDKLNPTVFFRLRHP